MPEITELHAFAHDLRHYLRESITQSQLAQRRFGDSLTPEVKASFEAIAKVGLECDRLIKAMVEYVEAGASAVKLWPLKRAMQALPSETRRTIDEAKGRLSVDWPVGEEIDIAESLQDVWRELITNAAKFRHPDRPLEIALQIQVTPERVWFRCSDTGIGIPLEHQEAIFVPFRRLHARNVYPGFGLGLSRCRKIMRSLNGDLLAVEASDGAALEGWYPRDENLV